MMCSHSQKQQFSGEVLLSLEQNELVISDVSLYHRMALLLSPNSSGVCCWLSSGYLMAVWCMMMKVSGHLLVSFERGIYVLPVAAEVLTC